MQSFEYYSTHNYMYTWLLSIALFNDILYKNQSHVLDIIGFPRTSEWKGNIVFHNSFEDDITNDYLQNTLITYWII
mgnify:CR=1 FL=1